MDEQKNDSKNGKKLSVLTIKLSKIDVDEIKDDIPAITHLHLSKKQIKDLNIENSASEAVMRLFAAQLVDKKLVKKHPIRRGYFVYRNRTFQSILLMGLVVSLKHLQKTMKLVIGVDDGTTTFNCYLKEDTTVEFLKERIDKQYEEMATLLNDKEMSSTMRASMMMMQSCRYNLNQSLHYSKVELGMWVQLIGKLSEYNNTRICFVSKIVRVDGTLQGDYLEKVKKVHDSLYRC